MSRCLAVTGGAAPGDAKPDTLLAQTLTDHLDDYLSQHLALSKDGDTLPLRPTVAHLTSTYQPQLGDYVLVVIQWDVKAKEAEQK